MSDTIWAVIITGAFSVIVQIISNRRQMDKIIAQLQHDSAMSDAKLHEAQSVTDTKLEELTREVRKHNGFAEKIPVIEEKIKVANHRIDDLEHKKQ